MIGGTDMKRLKGFEMSCYEVNSSEAKRPQRWDHGFDSRRGLEVGPHLNILSFNNNSILGRVSQLDGINKMNIGA